MQQLITSRVSSQLSPSTLPRFHPSLLRTGSNYCSGPSSAPSLYLTFSSEEIQKSVSSRQVPPALEPWIVTPGGGGQTTLSQGSLSDIYFTFITQQNHSCEEAVKIIYVWRSQVITYLEAVPHPHSEELRMLSLERQPNQEECGVLCQPEMPPFHAGPHDRS